MFCVKFEHGTLRKSAKAGVLVLSISILGGCGMNSVNLFDPGPPQKDTQLTTGSISPATPRPAMRSVYVAPGDTVNTIARAHDSTPSLVISANNLKPPYELNIGDRVLVPPRKTGSIHTPARSTPVQRRYVTVKQGDTLYSIARSNGVRLEDLAVLNRIPPPYNVTTGQALKLPSSGGLATGSITKQPEPVKTEPKPLRSVSLPPPPEQSSSSRRDQIYYFHKVVQGDTLPAIATQYKIDIAKLARLNQIGENAPLRTGQIVKVPM
ncbi:MAG: LysM peptidoglycan-binding domain-containing protein [Hyphomicrobiales bacterium]